MPVSKMAEEAFLQLIHTLIANQMGPTVDLRNAYMVHKT